MQQGLGLAILLITHDLGVVAEMCRTIAVMYAGRIVERGSAVEILAHPHHPYTEGLINALPRRARKGERLASIPGLVPAPGQRGQGCNFAGRCPRVKERCRSEAPPLAPIGTRDVACWYPLP